ncbi:outer membrane protein assembly factor BamD [Aureibacter tunicatorum]|nr:outer membrane protein assembly factor BamD [Aureibacter tunicatorum]
MAFFSGCASKFRQLQKSSDIQEKLAGALEYYDNEKYYKAATLLEEILPVLRGAEESEQVLFKLAYAYYYQKQYTLAGHYFNRFYETYTRSPLAEEALYMYAYSKYLESPRHSLDQSSTEEAIVVMQSFINKFPQSEKKEEASKIISELQKKLEKKYYEVAKQYYKLDRYKASMAAVDHFHKGFPDSKYNEELSFYKLKSAYNYATESFFAKKKERLDEAVKFYENFIDKYPESKYLKEAENLYGMILVELEEVNEQQVKINEYKAKQEKLKKEAEEKAEQEQSQEESTPETEEKESE